jgi:sRNA-binding protein
VKIHYLGWDPLFDEVVPRSRLQLDDRAIEKTREAEERSRRLLEPPQPEATEKGLVPANAGPIESTNREVSATTRLELKQVLQVESGRSWWASRVIDLLPDGKVKIHYLGWDPFYDEIVPRSRLQLDERAIEKAREAGEKLTRLLDQQAEVTEKGLVPVNAGPIASTGRAVSATTPLELKQVLQVESGRTWWAARVIDLLPDGRVKIHYLGWSAASDEIVPRSRLQLDDQAIEKTGAKPATRN